MAVRQEDLRFDTWREVFNRHYVSRVNVQIIEAINQLIGCTSDREFASACGKDRWKSHVEDSGKSRRPIYYDRLREGAYFLGIPPWVLVAGDAGNEEIRALFEMAPSGATKIDFSGPDEVFHRLANYLSRIPLQEDTRRELKHALSIVERHVPQCRSGPYDSIEDLLTDAKSQPPGARILREVTFPSSAGPGYRGTLCFSNGEYQHGERIISKRRWASAWFAIETDRSDSNARPEINSILGRIQDALQFDYEWDVEVHPTPATTLILRSWHSGIIGKKMNNSSVAVNQKNIRRIKGLVAEKLADPYRLVTTVHAYDQALDNLPDTSKPQNKYSHILEWISQDVTEVGVDRAQREDPLAVAVRNGIANIGYQLYFNRQRFLPASSLLDISQPIATIVHERGQTLLSFKGQTFKIADLTSRILRELGHTAWITRCHEPELFWSFDEYGLDPFFTGYAWTLSEPFYPNDPPQN